MKLLITGDWHLTNKSPKNRKDNYFETVKTKLRWIMDMAKKHKCAYILQPGDLFDSFTASDFLIQEIILILKQYKTPILTVPGQHDLRYHNSNIKNTPIAILEASGCVIILSDNYLEDGRFQFHGAGWGQDIVDVDHGFCFLITHRMVVKDKKIWHAQEEFSRASILFKTNNFDVIIAGDNHQSFLSKYQNRYIFNCGSLMRSTIAQVEHVPCIYIYDTKTKTCKKYNVPIQPIKEVFDVEKATIENVKNKNMEVFINSLKSGKKIEGLDFSVNLENEIKENKIEQSVIDALEEIINGADDSVIKRPSA